ncbi:hypothetical protein [Nocardiopsis sp. L17-MgMaSL7]|uniref:TPR repeat region-containing protein n=1 Tax=Nocardiopsis sp. L17-MgMaSL7 TaxID=1938893 RepID=UPI0011B38524|nr:hypothetical protein [Nocardiopsis sp. L17-MgMaSL7]
MLVMNGDPDIYASPLEGLAEELHAFTARILGRANDLHGSFDDTAQQFSEVLKWSIENFSEDDQALWSDVSANMSFCAAIVENWKDTVKTYKDERLRIINRWNEEAPTLAADLDKAPPMIQFMWNDSPAEAAEKALEALKNELEDEESTAYRLLKDTGDQLSDDLKSGPTVEAVGRLMEGGYVTWSQFNLGGSVSDLPEDVDPEEMAESIVPYVNGDKELDDDYYEMLAVLSGIGWRAERANSGDGENMDPADMEFLKEFYDQLEDSIGVADLARLAPMDEFMGAEDAAPLLAALGTGILVLSDQRLKHGDDSVPGGYHDLPASVRAAVEGDPDFGMRDIDWEAVGNLFGHVPEGVEGGRGLSLTLGLTIGHELDSQDPYFISDENLEHMQAALEVATRNTDANADMISGPGDWFEHPRLGDIHEDEKRQAAFEAILTREWPDDGAAASGYTDWILEAKQEAGDDSRAVDEVAKDLIEFLTDDERYERMTDLTGGMYSDHFGQSGLSFTQVNNEMGKGLLGVYGAYVDAFSLNPEDEGRVTISESNGALLMGIEERERFLEFVAGDEESAVAMVAITEMYIDGLVEGMFFDGDEEVSARNAGEHANRLNEVVNQALVSEAHSRTESSDSHLLDEYERRKAGRELLVEMVFKPGELISTKNPVGQLLIDDLLSSVKDSVTAAATDSVSLELGPVAEMNSQADSSIAANHIRAGSVIIDHYIADGDIEESRFDDFEHLEFQDGHVVISGYENQFRSDVQDEIDELLAGVGDGRGTELLESYLEHYHQTKTDGTGGEKPEADVERPDGEDK